MPFTKTGRYSRRFESPRETSNVARESELDIGGAPKAPTFEPFTAPELDVGRVRAATQTYLAPAVTAAREALVRGRRFGETGTATGRRFTESARRASDVLSRAQPGATQAGLAEVLPQYQAEIAEAKSVAEAANLKKRLDFELALREYQKEETESIRRGGLDVGGETYRQAAARLNRTVGMSPEEERLFFMRDQPRGFTRVTGNGTYDPAVSY